jgi:SAM-dependent methyltransferase
MTQKNFRLTPQQFLRDLGLKKSPELEDDALLNEIRAVGADPAAIHDAAGFGPAAGDAFFATERIARSVLSGNFDRLTDQLHQLTSVRGFPQHPKRIADLSGGAGIIGMFLAQQHPEAHVTVWDWSERALAMGRKWAAERKISNIDFHRAAYAELANVATPDCDLVVMFYAIDFHPGDDLPGHFPSQEGYEQLLATPPPNQYLAVSQAMFNLLSSDGVGSICGNWSEPGALWLFESLRQAKLTIDWDTSFTKGRVEKNTFVTKLGYAFVRKNVQPMTRNTVEDTLGFFASGEVDTGKLIFSIGGSGALIGLFQSGAVLAEVEGDWTNGVSERCRLTQCRGLLLLEHSTNAGFRQTHLTSLAAVGAQLEKIAQLDKRWKSLDGFTISKLTLDASVQRMPAARQLKAP